METQIEPVVQIRNWSIDRINELVEGNMESQLNAVSIAEEFSEWINIKEEDNEINYLCLEDENWTDEQEIDII